MLHTAFIQYFNLLFVCNIALCTCIIIDMMICTFRENRRDSYIAGNVVFQKWDETRRKLGWNEDYHWDGSTKDGCGLG